MSLHQDFESAVNLKDELRYWFARDIQVLFEYARWENFETAVKRAVIACEK